MTITPEITITVALIALFGVMVNVFVAVNNARKRGELDERLKLIELDRKDKSADDDRKRIADAATLVSILKSLEPESLIAFLRHKDFGATFRSEEIQPLRRYIYFASRPDQEFLTKELEVLRCQLLFCGQTLLDLIGGGTYPRRDDFSSVLPEEFIHAERPQFVEDNAAEINNAATEFVNSFDSLVREARSLLKV